MQTINMNTIPKILPIDDIKLPSRINYIGCAGFEDRATSSLDYFKLNNILIDNTLGIKYRPYTHKNRVKDFKTKIIDLGGQIKWRIYNRYNPREFERQLIKVFNWNEINDLIVDISGMSKMLILILLQNLKEIYHNKIFIIYCEAEIYHPTKQEYQDAIKIASLKMPMFLTSDIYRVITSPSLSSVSMQGYPILLIAYPTFNYLELITLYNEMNPQKIILIEGDPLNEKDKWRLDAIKEVNKDFSSSPDINSETIVYTTFDHIPNLEGLEDIYKQYCYTHKILVAPTGSKLQTIACSIFKNIYSDVQIVYPVTKAFIGEYSEGCRRIWGLDYTNFNNSIF